MIHGSVVFAFGRNQFADNAICPRLISVKGENEASWERKRSIWQGDTQRDKSGVRKRQKTKHDGSIEIVDDDEDASLLNAGQGSVGSGNIA